MTENTVTDEQRAKWQTLFNENSTVRMGQCGIFDDEQMIALCVAITADAVAAERARLAAAGEMTDGEIVAIARVVDSVASRQGEITALSVEMTMNQARALIAESAARATVVERERWLVFVKESLVAINSARSEVDAEWRNHDKNMTKHNEIVRAYQNKAYEVIASAAAIRSGEGE